jgi:hypothetical protein
MTRTDADDDTHRMKHIGESGSDPDYLDAINTIIDGLSHEMRRISLEIHGRFYDIPRAAGRRGGNPRLKSSNLHTDR